MWLILIIQFVVRAIDACASHQQIYIPLKTVSYRCLQTETKLKKCIFTECLHDSGGGQITQHSQTIPTKTCEETHCLIEQNGQLMGTPDCRRYALEQLSDNNRKPIIQWLEELENERLSYIDEGSADICAGQAEVDDEDVYEDCIYSVYKSKQLKGTMDTLQVGVFTTTSDTVIFIMAMIFFGVALVLSVLVLKTYQKCCWKSSSNDYTPGHSAISKT